MCRSTPSVFSRDGSLLRSIDIFSHRVTRTHRRPVGCFVQEQDGTKHPASDLPPGVV